MPYDATICLGAYSQVNTEVVLILALKRVHQANNCKSLFQDLKTNEHECQLVTIYCDQISLQIQHCLTHTSFLIANGI